MNYKLLKEHDKTFEIMHPDGKSFHVAKTGINKNLVKKIKDLPLHLADGGIIPDSSQVPTQDDSLSSILSDVKNAPVNPEYLNILNQEKAKGVGGLVSAEDQAKSKFELLQELQSKPREELSNLDLAKLGSLKAQASSQEAPKVEQRAPSTEVKETPKITESAPKLEGVGFGEQPKQKSPTEGVYGDLIKNIEGMKGATLAEAAAESKGQAQSAKLLEEQAVQQKKIMDEGNARLAVIEKEREELSKQYKDGKIDPGRWWANKSTGNKVGSVIALILGGLGSGLQGRENNVMKMYNDMQNKDIEAQKSEMDKKNNLLSINYKKYGDVQAAMNATMLQQNTLTQTRLAQIAANTNSETVKQKARIAAGQIEQQNIALKLKIAESQVMGGLASGQGNLTPQQFEALPAETKERVISVDNRNFLANTKEDAQEVKKQMEFLNPLDKLLNAAENHIKQSGTTVPFSGNDKIGKQIKEEIVLQMNKLHDLNRLTETEYEAFKKDIVPDLGQMRSDLALKLLGRIRGTVHEKRNEVLSGRVTGYKPLNITESLSSLRRK